jgi:hypothetical protein
METFFWKQSAQEAMYLPLFSAEVPGVKPSRPHISSWYAAEVQGEFLLCSS